MTTWAAETPWSFSELWVVFFNSTSVSNFFFLYLGKKGTTYNCLVHRHRKTVTGGTAGTNRSCNWKIRMGNFIVRSVNDWAPQASHRRWRWPAQSKPSLFHKRNKKIKKERKEKNSHNIVKRHHNEAWSNSPRPHPKTQAPPPLAISVCHGKEKKWPPRENHEPLASRTS